MLRSGRGCAATLVGRFEILAGLAAVTAYALALGAVGLSSADPWSTVGSALWLSSIIGIADPPGAVREPVPDPAVTASA